MSLLTGWKKRLIKFLLVKMPLALSSKVKVANTEVCPFGDCLDTHLIMVYLNTREKVLSAWRPNSFLVVKRSKPALA